MLTRIVEWFRRSFGTNAASAPASVSVINQSAAIQPSETGGSEAPPVSETIAPEGGISVEACAFLQALLDDQQPHGLQEFSLYDRTFIATLLNMLNSNAFEIPLLPEGAVRIQKLLADPRADSADFVDIFKGDPALSAALIRMANSAAFGATTPIHDLQLAASRIGLNQIQGLVIMMSLRTRVLHGKGLQREVELLTGLSLKMAMACQQLAPELGMSPGAAFTRGLLHHIEYFAILGISARYISSHQGEMVSTAALSEAIRRLGPPVHTLVINAWGLEMVELQGIFPLINENENQAGKTAADIGRRLDALQRSLIETWCSGSPPEKTPP